MSVAVRHTWFMIGRQTRNLMREPIWIALILIQPMIWLLLYGQLFKRVTHLGGFGTTSYVTFLAPAIVIMNAFFGATWSGMAMIQDLDRDVVERFLATPVSRLSLVLSQIIRSALTAAIQAVVILVVSLALGVRVHEGALGWLVVIAAAMLVNTAFAGISQGIALLTRKEATIERTCELHRPAAALPLLDPARAGADAALDADRLALQPGQLGRDRGAAGGAARDELGRDRHAPGLPRGPVGGDGRVRDLDVQGVPTDTLASRWPAAAASIVAFLAKLAPQRRDLTACLTR